VGSCNRPCRSRRRLAAGGNQEQRCQQVAALHISLNETGAFRFRVVTLILFRVISTLGSR
jgi:hypothetical protein